MVVTVTGRRAVSSSPRVQQPKTALCQQSLLESNSLRVSLHLQTSGLAVLLGISEDHCVLKNTLFSSPQPFGECLVGNIKFICEISKCDSSWNIEIAVFERDFDNILYRSPRTWTLLLLLIYCPSSRAWSRGLQPTTAVDWVSL
jgi:hypothetical protein